MDDSVSERSLNRLPQIRLNFIDDYISSNCYILNLPEPLQHIRKANKLASILCALESNRTTEKE